MKVLWGGLAAIAAVLFLMTIGPLVKLLIISALLAYVLDPVAGMLEARGLSRLWATAIIFLALGTFMAFIGLVVLPAMIRELVALQDGASADQTRNVVAQLQRILADRLAFLGVEHFDLTERIQQAKIRMSSQMLEYLVNEGPALLTHIIALPFIVFFLIKDGREIKASILRAVPNRYFEFSLNLIAKTDQQLGSFLRGQFLDAAVFGLISTIAMWILGVRYFLFIGIFSGLANLIPYVGPIAGATLATVITMMTTGDFARVGYVLLAFVIAKLLDDSILQPIIVARSVHMHPLLVLLVVIIGGEFFGIIGMLLSVPATGIVRVAVRESVSMARRYNLNRRTAQ